MAGAGYFRGVEGKRAASGRIVLTVIAGGQGAASPAAGDTDADDVRRARLGDNGARASLFRRYLKMVRQRVFRLLGPDADAEDVVQDAFIGAFTNLHKLVDPNAFGAWLTTIAVHLVNHRLRRRKLLRRLGFSRAGEQPGAMDAAPATGVSPALATEARRFYAALDVVPTEARIAFLLRHLEEMTVPEVAAHMGMSERTVKRRIATAAAHLAPLVQLDSKETQVP